MTTFNLKKDIDLTECTLINFINIDDTEGVMLREWRNNDDIRKWMYTDHLISVHEHQHFLTKVKKDNKNFYWIIKYHNDYIGTISLNKIDFTNKNAYLGIYANPYCKIDGVGKLLGRVVPELAFKIAGLHTLKLEVLEKNTRAINFYKKTGFEEEGKLKEFIYKDNLWHNIIIMGIINKNDEI